MAESVLVRGIIELVADSRKLKAGIEDAKKSIRTLGEGQKDISASASQSIDKYIGRLQTQNATLGKSARETELFKLALRGASNEQIRTADSALRLAESHARNVTSINALKTGFIALGAIAATSLIAAAVAFDQLVKKAGDFQDMAEKIGDTAESVASLAVAAAVGGASMESVVTASVKLTKGLTGVDDESVAAGAAIEALELNLASFKALAPADQFETVAKALAGFEDGAAKTAVAVALFGKAGAEMLPFLKELGAEGGRQTILTGEQIRLADEYSDRQKKLRTEIGLYAESIVIEMLPAYNELTTAFRNVIKGMAEVETESGKLKNSTSIKDFANSAVEVLLFVVNSADGVARAFEIVGKRIAAVAATASALTRGALIEAINIEIQSVKDINEALTRPLMGSVIQAEIAAMRGRAASGQGEGGTNQTPPQDRPRINFSGAVKKDKTDNSAAQEAKAQLAFDLDQIKKASDATIGTFANAEKIMEAMRSAALVDERDYYESKRGFITVNAAVQVKALEDQIARLEKETFTGKNAGKEQIDNERAIAALKAQVAKVREDAAANITVTSIKEADANKKIAQSYIDATIAANAYIDAIKRRNEREIEGIGRGNKFREQQAGVGAIDDTLRAQQQKLAGELRRGEIMQDVFDKYLAVAKDTYEKEIALYQKRTTDILASEENWMTGASEALNNYYDEARNVAKQTQEAFSGAFRGLEDALVDFVKTGKLNFKSLVESILADVARMSIKQNITGPLAGLVGGAIGGSGGGGGWTELLKSVFNMSGSGGSLGNEMHFAGGGNFNSGQMALVGEQGPELVRFGRSGSVTPNHAIGGVVFNMTNNFSGGPPLDPQAFIAQVVPVMRGIAQNEIGTQLRPGGVFNG